MMKMLDIQPDYLACLIGYCRKPDIRPDNTAIPIPALLISFHPAAGAELGHRAVAVDAGPLGLPPVPAQRLPGPPLALAKGWPHTGSFKTTEVAARSARASCNFIYPTE